MHFILIFICCININCSPPSEQDIKVLAKYQIWCLLWWHLNSVTSAEMMEFHENILWKKSNELKLMKYPWHFAMHFPCETICQKFLYYRSSNSVWRNFQTPSHSNENLYPSFLTWTVGYILLGCAAACRESFHVFTFITCFMTQPAGQCTYCQSKARYSWNIF